MKSIFAILLACSFLLLAACGGQEVEEQPAPQEEIPPVVEEEPLVRTDLTELSATMVYAEVFNMLSNPADYEGKIIKADGIYNYYQDPETGLEYHAVVIQDATACCAQGLEFILGEGEYPTPNSPVILQGEFQTYQEGDLTFCHLVDATLLQEELQN